MRKITTIFLLLLCTIVVKAADAEASIVFSDPFVQNNLEHIYKPENPSGEPYTEKTVKGGLACLYIPSGKYAYFKVNSAVITPSDKNLLIKITYFDEGTDNLKLQYNSLLTNPGNPRYKDNTVKKSGTNGWITATIALTDAAFNKLQNNGADFRIAAGSYIREILIDKGALDPESEPVIPVTASAYSEFKGKSVAGYQAWFSTGNETTGWFHWNGTRPPSKGKLSFEVYPDVTEYDDADLAQTALANLGNGEPSKLFNSANTAVVDKHFEWMKDYGIDGVAVQRFIGSIGTSIIKSDLSLSNKIKNAAEENERIFYICYDISSNLEDTWTDVIKFDWVYNVERNNDLIQSPSYAKVGNKPVVQIWGPGFTGRPGNAEQTIDLINFLKSRGCYVIGGLPTAWRTEREDSKPNFLHAYKEFDMISPWLVGRFKDNNGANSRLTNYMTPDKNYCDQNGIDYMPVLFPGFAWSQWNPGPPNDAPRNTGEFMWNQAKNIKSLGVSNMYFAMFDEYDEGTAIMKAATDWSMIPTDQYFLTTSADGYWLSSDFQLRVAGAAIEMLKGIRPVTTNVPVAHSEGPVYYRNSFEKRTTPYNYVDNVSQNTGTFNLDPCFKNPGVWSNVNLISPICLIQQNTVRNGLYSVKASGTVSSSSQAKYYYKFAETKIPIKPDMRLSFWKNTVDENGRFVFVDFITKKGKNLRDYGYVDQAGQSMHPQTGHGTVGAGWEQFVCEFGSGVLLGDTIINIMIAYDHVGAGSYTAYFDDFLIDNGEGIIDNIEVEAIANAGYVYFENGQLFVKGYPENSIISVYNLMGQEVKKFAFVSDNIYLSLSSGMYIVRVQYGSKSGSHKIIVDQKY